MKTCPHCGKLITALGVEVSATMRLDPVLGYSSIEDVLGTNDFFCLDCGNSFDFSFGEAIEKEFIDIYEKGEQ